MTDRPEVDAAGGSPSAGTVAHNRSTLGVSAFEVTLRDPGGRESVLHAIHFDDDGRFSTEVVGDDGPPAIDPGAPTDGRRIQAVLVPDLTNPNDRHAVSVHAVGGGRLGRLSDSASAVWQPALIRLFNTCEAHVCCPAEVRGGAHPAVWLDVAYGRVAARLDTLEKKTADRIALDNPFARPLEDTSTKMVEPRHPARTEGRTATRTTHAPAPRPSAPAAPRSNATAWWAAAGVLLVLGGGAAWWRASRERSSEAREAALLAERKEDRERARPVAAVPADWFGKEATGSGKPPSGEGPSAAQEGSAVVVPVGGAAQRSVTVLRTSPSYTVTESSDAAWRYAWKVEVVNVGPSAVTFDVAIRFLDAAGAEIRAVDESGQSVTANGTKTLSGSVLIDLPQATNVATIRATPKVR